MFDDRFTLLPETRKSDTHHQAAQPNILLAQGEPRDQRRVTYDAHLNVIKVQPMPKGDSTKRSTSQNRGLVSPLDFSNLTNELAKEISVRNDHATDRLQESITQKAAFIASFLKNQQTKSSSLTPASNTSGLPSRFNLSLQPAPQYVN